MKAALIPVGVVTVLLLGLATFAPKQSPPEISTAPATPAASRAPLETSDRKENHRQPSASPYPIKYTIGQLDPRFGVSRERLLQLIAEAARVWGDPVHRTLFSYDSAGGFKINLSFDERQAGLVRAKGLKARIAADKKSYKQLKREYDVQVNRVQALEDRYNAKVQMWNNAGGAPPAEFARLEDERLRLREAIERENDLAESVNETAARNNLAGEEYNDHASAFGEFEQGVYDGRMISLYAFENDNDLRITLVHELGHVLGFGHVNDPKAVMYYLHQKQSREHITLTDADLKLLFGLFPMTSSGKLSAARY